MDLHRADDPGAAFFEADRHGRLVSLRTSGTTAAARSVLRTTDSWTLSFPHVTTLLAMTASSTVWVPGPLSSSMNLFAAVHAHTVGARVTDDPDSATHAHLTPSTLRTSLERLRPGAHVVVAGDRLPVALHQRATQAGLRVDHYYGSAELSFVAWGAHEDDLRPFPGAVVEIRSGVIWVRSPYLCRTCEGDAGALETDEEGFATVGDRGHLVDGRLVVDGRGDTVVTTGGATVIVAEVEAVLSEVADVAVVGVPHPQLGEVVTAVVNDGSAFRRLRAHARAHLPREQQPRLWFEVREAPSTEAGKLDRSSLRSLVARGGPGVRRLT